MELSVFELSKHLNVSPDTVERWIRQGKLPVSKKGNTYRFKTLELKKWASKNNIRLDIFDTKNVEKKENTIVSLSQSIRNGGVYTGISGQDSSSVLAAAVETIANIPEEQKASLLDQLIEREAALSTGIGKGFAIPHPRQPQNYLKQPMVCVCFLDSPVDYKALDNQPVSVLFFILCPDLKMHLQLLSGISFCLKDHSFVDFLASQPDEPALVEKIEILQKNNPL